MELIPPENLDEWNTPAVMLGPIKCVVFCDEHGHGLKCLMGRLNAWLIHNPDWDCLDTQYGIQRVIMGVPQMGLSVYVQDKANPCAPIMQVDEPEYRDHCAMLRGGPQPMSGFGMAGMQIAKMGSCDEMVEWLKGMGMPQEYIDAFIRMNPEDAENVNDMDGEDDGDDTEGS